MSRYLTLLILIILIFPEIKVFSQKDTEFWFVAPEVSKYGSYNMDIPIYLRISTYDQASTVTVSEPANSSFTPIVVSIPASGFQTVDLSPFLDMVENKPPNTLLTYGIHIIATTPVSIYYEVASTYCNCNPEIFTLKGRNSVGTNFIIPTQNFFNNATGYTPVPYNAFDIVATLDNTILNITPTKPIVGHSAGVTFPVTLNRGQTWSGVATSQAAANHLWGTTVVSNNPIAITQTDDLLHGITGCADLVGDQIVPVEITGTDYVVIRGNLTNDGNRAFIVATQDNTNVYIDGSSTPIATLNKGQLYDHDITNPSASISASFPVYVYETSGFGCELGSALIPSINCNGSTQVVFTRTTNQQLGVQIATQTPYTSSFLLNGNSTMITTSDFAVVPGTGGNWQTANKTFSLSQIPVGTVVTITNTAGAFHLGLLIGDVGGGCSYGYFSDFAGLNLGPDVAVCQGNSATFDAGSGWSTYLWNTGATTQTITTGTAGQYWVKATNAQCIAYDTINLIVNNSPHPNLGPDISFCSGSMVTLSSTGGPYASYLWSTGSTLPTITVSTGGIYSLLVRSSNDCTGSDTIIVTREQTMPVSVTIGTPVHTVCAGTSVTYTATPINPGNAPVYVWKVNGSASGSNSNTFTYIPADGDIVSCDLTSSFGCTTNNPASSNQIAMTVMPVMPVSLSISGSVTTVCAGTAVTFTAAPVNPGNAPVYAWKVNGAAAGTNSSVFTYIPLNGDVVGCEMTSDLPCTTGNPAISNQLPITVTPVSAVSVSITASGNNVCSGTAVTFNAMPVNPGVLPVYEWKVNGSVALTGTTIFTYTPVNGDVVSFNLTSSLSCTTNNPATSNAETMNVISLLPVSVSISAPSYTVCAGTSSTFTAAAVNPGDAPVYAWKVNGLPAGSNSSVFTCIPLNGDVVNCQLASSLQCTTGNPANSNIEALTVNPLPAVSFNSCFDTISDLTAQPVLLKGGIPSGGSYSGPGVTGTYFNPSSAGPGIKTITYVYQNMYHCGASASRTINVLSSALFSCGQTMTDARDGKTYTTVRLGTQCWMETNLNFGNQLTASTHQTDNCQNEKYCYNNESTKCIEYGGLYQWDELMRYQSAPGSQGLCMAGWHVPTQAEWMILFNYYQNQALAGKPLQDTIISGFRAGESGLIYSNEVSALNGFATMFWTSTPSGTSKAISHGMNLINFSVSDYQSIRSNALPVRCIKD
ncbi:MAG: hypothetical protein NTU51_11040 [Bacteroidetes bacterium]|nr:hypothetical protein [Bacteroidota bacterium]